MRESTNQNLKRRLKMMKVISLLSLCCACFADAQISQILGSGRVIRLSDGSTYEIDPADRARGVTWMQKDKHYNPARKPTVIVINSHDGSLYPIILQNSLTGESIRAKAPPTDRTSQPVPEDTTGWDPDDEETG